MVDWRGYLLPAGNSKRIGAAVSQIYHLRWCQDLPELKHLSDDGQIRRPLRGTSVLFVSSRKVSSRVIVVPGQTVSYISVRRIPNAKVLDKSHARREPAKLKRSLLITRLNFLSATMILSLLIRTRLALPTYVLLAVIASILSGCSSASSPVGLLRSAGPLII